MNIGWPEGLYLAINIFFLALGILGTDGEKKKGCAMAIALMLWAFVTLPLLWWGGFFA